MHTRSTARQPLSGCGPPQWVLVVTVAQLGTTLVTCTQPLWKVSGWAGDPEWVKDGGAVHHTPGLVMPAPPHLLGLLSTPQPAEI